MLCTQIDVYGRIPCRCRQSTDRDRVPSSGSSLGVVSLVVGGRRGVITMATGETLG